MMAKGGQMDKGKNGKTTGDSEYKVGPGKPPLETRFSSENQPKNRRKKEVKTVLKQFRHDVSDEVLERIAGVMLAALACKSTKDASEKLRQAEKDEPEYGWIFEQTILAIKKDGLKPILDVLEWIFGKNHNINLSANVGLDVKPLVDLTKRAKNGEDDSVK